MKQQVVRLGIVKIYFLRRRKILSTVRIVVDCPMCKAMSFDVSKN